MDFRHIVVAIDFSESSRIAFHDAVRLAQHSHAHLTALHLADVKRMDWLPGSEETPEPWIETLRNKLEHWVTAELPKGQVCDCEVLAGQPSQDLSCELEVIQGDLLVLGARSHGNPQLRLGTVAGNCVRKATSPLMWISRNEEKPHTVVACIDYAESSSQVMMDAIELAEKEDAKLHVIHVATPPFSFAADFVVAGVEALGGGGVDSLQWSRIRQDHEKRLRTFVEAYKDRWPERGVECHVLEHVSPARAILEYLERSSHPVVVLGVHGRTRLGERLLGTTTERVLHEAQCSALLVRSNAEVESSRSPNAA